MTGRPISTVVLISGRGSNLQALIDQAQRGNLPIRISAVISNVSDAPGLNRARKAQIRTFVVDHRRFTTRAQFDRALMQTIDHHQPALIVLAGFMRILGAAFIDHYAGRLLNIHPSLLPRFPGLDTHRRALQSGAVEHGATVHFVTRDLDAGPIVVQKSVPIFQQDTPDTLAARVLEVEHVIFPLAVRWFAEGRLGVRDGKAWLDKRIALPQTQTEDNSRLAQSEPA